MPVFSTSLLIALSHLGWAHLATRPGRTLLTIIGVGLGVAATIAVQTANLDVLRSFESAVLTVAGPTSLQIEGGELGVDERLIAVVRQVPGVVSAAPVVLQTAIMVDEHAGRHAVQILGVDMLAEADSRGFRLSERKAERELEALLDPESLYVGSKLAAEWHLAVGSRVELVVGTRRMTCHVAGLLHDAVGRPSTWERIAVMDIAAAQVLFGLVGRLDRIDLVTESGVSPEDLIPVLQAALPPHLTVERPASRTQKVEEMIRAFRLNLMVLSWVGLLVGVFLIYNTMSFAIAQRRREIGIYRAIGMTQGRVAVLFLAEAGLLGMLGGIVGSVGGTWLAQNLIALISRTISDLYVPVGAADTLTGSGRFAGALFEGIGVGACVSLIGAIGPSLDASRTATVRALAPGDYEASRQVRVGSLSAAGSGLLGLAWLLGLAGPVAQVPVWGYVATFCLLAGLSCLTPLCVTGWTPGSSAGGTSAHPMTQAAIGRIAVDHAARNPGRNGVTVSALMVGLAIMIGVVIMVRSFRHTVELWINDTVVADLVVAPSTWLRGAEVGSVGRSLPPSWRATLVSVPGVEAVDTYRDVRLEVQGHRVALVSRDLRLHARRSRYLVRSGDSSDHLIRAADLGGVLVSEVLAHRLGVEEGQSLEIETPAGTRRFPVVAVFYDYATDGGKIVLDRSLYQSLWQDHRVTVFPLYLTAGADVDRVRERVATVLADHDGASVPPLLISNGELRQEILEIFDRTFLMTYVLEAIAVIIAMLGIVNTLVTSVLERRREFATLRAIGGSAGQIQQLVLWEAAYLGLLGIALGLVGGGALSVLLVNVINKQSFGWTIQMIVPIGALLQAVGLAGAATLVAGYFPARWAAKQPIAEGLREE